jgi:hypothetical protein
MAAAVKSDNVGGKYGHMHLILKENKYTIATKNTTATVGLIKKPLDVNPKFQSLKRDKLTKYKVLQLEAETDLGLLAVLKRSSKVHKLA